MIRLGWSRPIKSIARLLARTAGVTDPDVEWRLVGDGPWFDNQLATLTVEGRRIAMRLERAIPRDDETAKLEKVLERTLA